MNRLVLRLKGLVGIALVAGLWLGPGTMSQSLAGPTNPDDLVIIVNGRNAISSLTHEALVNIFSGRFPKWKQVGGADMPIMRLVQKAPHPNQSRFIQSFGLPANSVEGATEVTTELATVLFVAIDQYAIGYVSAHEAEQAIANGVRIKIIKRVSAARGGAK